MKTLPQKLYECDLFLNKSAVRPKKIRTPLERIAAGDRSAVKECVDAHGKMVWSLAKQSSISTAAAEIFAREVFKDIWRYADRFDRAEQSEADFIRLIARRRSIIRAAAATGETN